MRSDQLRRCGLMEEEVLAHLRRNGVGSLAEVRYVLYETKGELIIVRERGPEAPDPELVRIALHDTPLRPPLASDPDQPRDP
jgi:uncharacterized membrane protein YcaP (DUF421 family)